MSVARLVVDLIANTEQFRREMDSAAQKMDQTGRRMQRVGGQLAARVTLPLLAIGGAAVKMAVDAEESANKFNVVMGDAADDVRDRFRDLQDTIPLTQNQMESLAAGVQDLLVPLGFVRSEAANMSADMVELAADLASFNNVAADVPLEALKSALAGQSRPLRSFGVDVSQARLELLALEEGLISQGEALNANARAQAVMIAVNRDSADAIGDAAATAGSAANQLRFLRVNVMELGQSIGEILLPAFIPIVQAMNNVVRSLRDMEPATQRMIVVVGGLAAAVGPLLIALGTLVRTVGYLASVASSGAGALRPLLLVITRINPVVAVLSTALIAGIAAWRRWGDQVTEVGQAVRTVLIDRLQPVVAFVEVLSDRVKAAFLSWRDEILPAIAQFVTGLYEQMIDRLGPIIGGAARIIGRLHLMTNPALARALDGVQEFVRDVQTELASIRSGTQDAADAMNDFASLLDMGRSGSSGGQIVPDPPDYEPLADQLSDIVTLTSDALALDVEWAGLIEDAIGIRDALNERLADGVTSLEEAVELTRLRVRLERDLSDAIQRRMELEGQAPRQMEMTLQPLREMASVGNHVAVSMATTAMHAVAVGEAGRTAADIFRDNWLAAIQVIGSNLGGLASQVANVAGAFASGGPWAAAAAGASIVIDALFGGPDAVREAAEGWQRALDDFTDMLADQTRWDRMRSQVEGAATGLIEQAILSAFAGTSGAGRAMAGEFAAMLSDMVADVGIDRALEAARAWLSMMGASVAEIDALTDALRDNLAAIEERRAAEAASMQESLEIRNLVAMGRTEEADAMRLEIERRAEMAQAMELGGKALAELLRETWAIEDAARDAAEALAQMRFETANELSLWERQAALAGDDMAALSFRLQRQAQEEIWALEDLVDAGKLSIEMFNEWTDVIEGEVAQALAQAEQAMRDAAQAAREAAEAERQRYRQTQGNLQLRILEAQGNDAAARALRNRLEMERFLADGADAATLALLQQAQAAEAVADAQRRASQAAQEVTRSMDQMGTAMNAPTGLRLSLMRFRSSDPAMIGASVSNRNQTSVDQSVRIGTVVVQSMGGDTGEDILRKIREASAKRQRQGGTNPMTNIWDS